jgi:hypothetical protein
MVPGATANVFVTRFESPHHLAFDWDGAIHVAMTFDAFGEGGTRVAVEVSGFEGADVLSQATDAIEGFAIVLCDLKTLLETGESAGLVRAKAELIIAAQATRGG